MHKKVRSLIDITKLLSIRKKKKNSDVIVECMLLNILPPNLSIILLVNK